ncbi:dienelactone hydrolase [Duganella sp. 1224]|uniref:alpha/beta fold hydrolase n=1 Tax=Duganella sp. 1224 TaxID=2587052 RepID=UPI0015C88096|nr:alpha/beta hydrolase [Duganella sp. 1224]NYE63122.1 dienelactone hydrolase [Duganella sp. 1224]
MNRHLLFAATATVLASSAFAARVLDEAPITIDGQPRRYYHLHDTEAAGNGTPILLISGSGCKDFGSRVPFFFERYPAPVDVYFLEKTGIGKGDTGDTCSAAYNEADYLERRVSDNLAFIDSLPALKALGPRSLAVLGFSEGGVVAPLVALRSKRIGWLATGGSGGLPQSEGFLIFADRGVKPYADPLSRDIFQRTYAAIKADPDSLQKEFMGHPYRYWSSHLFYDPLVTYRQLDIPIIAAMGEKDDSEAIESGRALRDDFARHPEKDFTFIEYPNASHALQAPDKAHLQDYIAGLADWLKGRRPAPR